MSKFRTIKNSLLGGMISPTALARTDLPQYHNACEVLQNMIPMLVGGAYRRPGTLNVDTLPIASGSPYYSPKVIPFTVSPTEAYCVVISAGGTVAIYRATGNGGSTTNFIKAAVSGNAPAWVFSTLTSWLNGGTVDDDVHLVQYAQSNDFLFLTHPNFMPFVIQRTALDTFVYGPLNSFTDINYGWVPYRNQNTTTTTMTVSATSGAGVTLTASANYFATNHVGSIFKIDQGSSVGAIIITAVNSATVAVGLVLVSFTATSAYATWWESAWSNYRGWPRTVCIFQQRLCYGGVVPPTATMAIGSPAVPDMTDTVWFSATANYFQFSVLNNTAKAQFVVINGNLQITSQDTQQNGGVLVATGYIHFPVDDSDGDGQTTGPTGGQPFKIQLAQNTEDVIQWLSPDKELLIGTQQQEWIISPANNDFSIGNSPTQIQSKYGSDYLMASRIGYELIFPLRSQDEVRAYQYNYIDASFFAEPVQLLFDQYPMPELGAVPSAGRKKFRWFDWDVSRQTLWCLDTWGNFFGMTRDRKLNTTMWHVHQFGGTNTSQGLSTIGTGNNKTIDPAYYMTDGSVISFCVLPNPYSGINDIWLVVKRTIAGVPSWQLERMIGKNIARTSAYQNIFPGLAVTEPFLVDSAVATSDVSTGFVYGGLNCLNGYAPSGNYYSYTNGIFVLTGSTVAYDSGDSKYETTITSNLPPDYGNGVGWLVFGLPFTSILQPTRPDAGSVIGTAQGAIKKINRAFIRIYRTMSLLVGSPPTGNLLQVDGTYTGEDQQSMEQIDFNQIYQPMNRGPELFTGDKKVQVSSTYDRSGYLYIMQSDPMPLTVVGIIYEGVEFDG